MAGVYDGWVPAGTSQCRRLIGMAVPALGDAGFSHWMARGRWATSRPAFFQPCARDERFPPNSTCRCLALPSFAAQRHTFTVFEESMSLSRFVCLSLVDRCAPRGLWPPPSTPHPPPLRGVLPKAADGRPLNLDFETGTLRTGPRWARPSKGNRSKAISTSPTARRQASPAARRILDRHLRADGGSAASAS